MRRYNVCVESYLGNNSDIKEYDNYYYDTESWEKAKEYAERCIANWNKQDQEVVYNIYNITPHN